MSTPKKENTNEDENQPAVMEVDLIQTEEEFLFLRKKKSRIWG
jgi:hypothetical protein